jgi:hypothetical protein
VMMQLRLLVLIGRPEILLDDRPAPPVAKHLAVAQAMAPPNGLLVRSARAVLPIGASAVLRRSSMTLRHSSMVPRRTSMVLRAGRGLLAVRHRVVRVAPSRSNVDPAVPRRPRGHRRKWRRSLGSGLGLG